MKKIITRPVAIHKSKNVFQNHTNTQIKTNLGSEININTINISDDSGV